MRLAGLSALAVLLTSMLVWALDARAGVAIAAGLGVGGAVVLAQWLRLRQRAISRELARLGQAVAELGNQLTERDEQLRDRLGTQEKRRREQLDSLREDITQRDRRNRATLRQTFAQVQALQNLYAMLPVRQPMPALRESWAVSPDFMLLLVSMIQERRPATIVELGSGASTIWTALALAQLDLDSQLISIEHDAEFGERTRDQLAAHGLDKRVDIRYAQLVDLELDGEIYPWYDRAVFSDVDACDMLIVDGPPGGLRAQSRYPALPMLADRMAAGSCVMVDDYGRDAEREMVARWTARLTGWTVAEFPLEKGAAVLTRE